MSEFCYTCRSRPCECYKMTLREIGAMEHHWRNCQAAVVEELNGGPKPTVYAPSYFDHQASRLGTRQHFPPAPRRAPPPPGWTPGEARPTRLKNRENGRIYCPVTK